MNKYFKALIVVVLLPVSVALPVLLVQTINQDSQVYAQASTLQQRIEQYKSKITTQPSKSELSKLQLHCKVAQTNLKTLDERIAKVQTKRTEAYKTINTRLQKQIEVLKDKKIAVADLEEKVNQFKTDTDKFNADLVTYKQAVADASQVDCGADPLAMRAALQESRNTHARLITELAQIRQNVNNLLKPSLKQVKEDLKAQQKADTNSSDSQTDQPSTNGSAPAEVPNQEGQINAAQ